VVLVRFTIEDLGIATNPQRAPLINKHVAHADAPGRRAVEKFGQRQAIHRSRHMRVLGSEFPIPRTAISI
jgi:hypothetical protein